MSEPYREPYKVFIGVERFGARCAAALALLRQSGCQILGHPEDEAKVTQAEFDAMLPQANAVIAGMHRWGEAQFATAKNLQLVGFFGVGVDHIDLAAAKRYGVKVMNAKGANADAVAEYTVGLIIALLRDMPKNVRAVRAGGWPRPIGTGLGGKTLGILGYGAIGRQVVQKLSGFDMRFLAYSRNPDHAAAQRQGVRLVGREELLAQSDILSLHAPATPETKNLIDAGALRAMKPGAWLINTARGALVDEAALIKALDSGRLSGAALDVFQREPPDPQNPLLHRDNVLCTPHSASETWKVYNDIALFLAEGVLAARAGQAPPNWLNP